jgi:hypothetical protein
MLPGSVDARAKINVMGLHSPFKSSVCVEGPLEAFGAAPPDPPFGAAAGAAGGAASASASCGCGVAMTAAIKVANTKNFILWGLSGE